MADDELHLIGPDEIAYRLELTPAQLKITYTALKSFLDDFGHDERDVHDVVREVLEKLPDEHADPLDRHHARAGSSRARCRARLPRRRDLTPRPAEPARCGLRPGCDEAERRASRSRHERGSRANP